jgi:hypothetical protein
VRVARRGGGASLLQALTDTGQLEMMKKEHVGGSASWRRAGPAPECSLYCSHAYPDLLLFVTCHHFAGRMTA